LHYHWFNILQWQASSYAPRLYNLLGLQPNQGVVIVGCGFNATGEGLANLGVRVIGVDLSTYINAEKGNTEEADIRAACLAVGVNPDTDFIIGPSGRADVNPLDMFLRGGRSNPQPRGYGQILQEEMRVRGSRNSVINAFNAQYPGVNIRYIITEEVLNSITDNEAGLVCSYAQSAAQEWGSTVIHMLSPFQEGATQDPSLNWKTYGAWRTWLNTNGFSTQKLLPTVEGSNQGVTVPVDNPAGIVTAYGGLI